MGNMKIQFWSILLLTILVRQKAQENSTTTETTPTAAMNDDNTTEFVDIDDDNFTESSFSEIPSEIPSSSPSQEDSGSSPFTTEGPSVFTTDAPSTSATSDNDGGDSSSTATIPPSYSKSNCHSLNILGKDDCRFACLGSRYASRYRTKRMDTLTGAIRKVYTGFQCQCLRAINPIDCVFEYDFQSCHNVGIYDCNLVGLLPSSSATWTRQSMPNISDSTSLDSWVEDEGNSTTSNSSKSNSSSFVDDDDGVVYEADNDSKNQNSTNTIGDSIVDIDNATIQSIADATSCATYCHALGFQEDTTDENKNDFNSLCTHNPTSYPTWTSCACSVDISIGGQRSISIVDGIYVCGDDGFETGLVFDGGSRTMHGFSRPAILSGLVIMGTIYFETAALLF